jgi:hypothetical protein
MGLGLMPLRFWRSYAGKELVAKPLTVVPVGPRLQGGKKGATAIQKG